MSRFECRPHASLTSRALIVGPVVMTAGLLAGCSVIGYFGGSKIDSHHTKLTTVDGWKVQRIDVGTTVQVFLRDRSGVAGVMRGVDVSPQEYGERYERWRGKHVDFGAPAIGESVAVEDVGGNRQDATFYGFDYGALAEAHGRSATIGTISFGKIDRVSTAGGASWAGSRLADLAAQGRVPLRSCLVLDNRRRIPLEEIDRVEVLETRHTARIVGLLVGAALDGLVIAEIAHSSSKPTPPPSPTYVSCPYVYSFDGERHVKEGDAFPGAMFAAVQRSDRLVLGHLDPSGGLGRIRLANELSEIEFVDEVKLVAVDGPENATVVAVPAGRFRALSELTSSVRAFDLKGRPVLQPAGMVDGGAWLSNPLATSSAGPAEAKDGIVLEFRRPASAKSVTLMFRAEPSPWASGLLVRVLALQGREYPAWYARMNEDAAARAEFLGALRREGHLAVQLWDGVGWRAAGDVPAHEAMELSLDGIAGETLRLRLLTTPGLWRVERVQADFGPEPPLEVAELSPVAARTAAGQDVSELLASTDGRRLVLKHGDSVDLVAALPLPKPGRLRTYFLKAVGYYAPQMPATGEPEKALFAKLLDQPGALGQYGRDVQRADLQRSWARLEGADHSAGN